jgi:GNAT superfamily N-acetyltransferase
MAERLRRLLPGLWAGMLLCIAALAAPAAFAALGSAEAGQVVSRIFVREAWLSLGLAALLLGFEWRQVPQAGLGNSVLLWTTVVCTALGYFAVQALMPAARVRQGVFGFAQLHLISTVFYGTKTLAVLLLAWRAAGLNGLSRRPSS